VAQIDLNLDDLAFEPLADRASKVKLTDLGRPCPTNPSIDEWVDSLPTQLAGKGLRKLRDAIVQSYSAGRPIVAALGGHVIKTGCAPYLIDWINKGLLQGVAMNGSASIHDLELAIAGHTSEDVGPRLMAGTFGFAQETSTLFAKACEIAANDGLGLGRALGQVITEHGGPGLESSLLVAAYRKKVPATVHVAIGTDIVHMTPQLDGAALGKSSLDDFRSLTRTVAGMNGGVWLNIGSAVVMPEVFLKAVSIVRNLGHSLDGMTAANLDFNQQYRGMLNVLQRPGAEGIALTGHHEIMIPLLHTLVNAGIAAQLAANLRVDAPHKLNNARTHH
jgi:hypothetical protein